MLKGKSLLVTGGAGFIGSHLVDRLLLEGPDKIVVASNFFLGKESNLREALGSGKVEIVKQDVCEYNGMKNIIERHGTEVVFNLAVIPLPVSLEKPEWCVRQNIEMTLSMCKLLREDMFKSLVQFSSSEAYGSAQAVPMSEEHPLLPETPYAASKAATDLIALSYHNTFGSNVSIVRPFNNYGPRQNAGKFAGLVPIVINSMLKNQEVFITGDGSQTRDFIYVTDTADGTIDICKSNRSRGKVVNLGSGKEISILNICEKLKEICGYKNDFVFKEGRPGDVARHFSDITIAKSIGFSPKVNINEGLLKSVEWYRKVQNEA